MSIRQRLYPEPGPQVSGMVEHCHRARFAYNIGLEQRSMWRRDKHTRGTHPEYGRLDAARMNTSTQMRELAQLRGELVWLRAGSWSVQQAGLRDLDRAFANFYAGRANYPQFKRRNDRAGSFAVRDLTVRRLSRKWGVQGMRCPDVEAQQRLAASTMEPHRWPGTPGFGPGGCQFESGQAT